MQIMNKLHPAICLICLAAAMSASAGVITISGSEFNAPAASGNQGNATPGTYVTYSTEGTFGSPTSAAQYDSVNQAASLVFAGNNGGGQEYAGVYVNSSVFSGTPGLGSLSQFYNGSSSFNVLSMNPPSGNKPGFATYWVINIANGANTLTIGLSGLGSTGANAISGSYQVEWYTGSANFNANAGQYSTVSLSTFAGEDLNNVGGSGTVDFGNWSVTSVGAEIGYWYEPQQNGQGVTSAEINSFTLSTVPEPNTMMAAGLLVLPMGAGALRMLRKKVKVSQ
jgi:hypothetical protein